MALAKNPRFCGVELKPITGPQYVGASVGGYLVRLWCSEGDAGTLWHSQVLLPNRVRLETVNDASQAAALRSLLAQVKSLHRAAERMLKRPSKASKGAK